MNRNIINIEDLKNAAQECATEIKQEFPNLFFDYAGLIPNEDVKFRYDRTPVNTSVFAISGGDGVHFSILNISETIQPIVLTVPMKFGGTTNNCNLILGENLDEFLSLGYYNGWFSLEQLCYKKEKDMAIAFYSQEKEDEEYHSTGDILFIKKLRTKLNFGFTPLNLDRLRKLEELYFGQLRF